MSLVVLDTNVLVSALLSPFGNPAKVLALALNGHVRLCYDSRVLTEYRDVLLRPKFSFNPDAIGVLLDSLLQDGIAVLPEPLDTFFADESDRIFYEVAKFCDAVLITGNLRHFPREPDILTPTEFIEGYSV